MGTLENKGVELNLLLFLIKIRQNRRIGQFLSTVLITRTS